MATLGGGFTMSQAHAGLLDSSPPTLIAVGCVIATHLDNGPGRMLELREAISSQVPQQEEAVLGIGPAGSHFPLCDLSPL